MDRIALVSDVHGNLTAWQAVLDDIATQDVSAVYCLGDLAGKGPEGARVVDSVREVCVGVVRGNWDDGLADPDFGTDPGWNWHRAELGPERLAYLGGLPHSLDLLVSGESMRLYHASAKSMHHRVFPDAPEAELQAMFANTDFTGHDGPEPTVVFYGDLHACFLVPVDPFNSLVNVGSVGNPLDGTLAGYAILEGAVGETAKVGWSVTFRHVPYDIEAAVAVARDVDSPGLDAYSIELRTGVYRSFHEQQGLSTPPA